MKPQSAPANPSRPSARPLPPFLAAGLALVLALTAACGAPASRPASGPVAEQVQASFENGEATFDHSTLDRLMAEGTRGGLVDYDFFRRHRSELDAYLEDVAEADLARLDPDHLMALLVNAYNALTIRSILEHWGVSSIREIDGVWTEAKHTVGGQDLTLDEIEHNLLRPFYQDPRIHFVVNCASASCAPLPPWAFDGERIEEQLEERTEAFLSDPDNVRIEGEVLRVSKYFDWYGGDFTAEGWEPRADTIPLFIARYTRPEVAEMIREHGGEPRMEFLDYDWSLNSVDAAGDGG